MAHYSVGVTNLEIWSPTGIHDYEKTLKVKLRITASLQFPFVEHLPVALSTTFDYSTLVSVIHEVCAQPHMLLEQICNGVIQRLHTMLNRPCVFHIRVEKMNPLPGEKIAAAFVDVVDELMPGKMRRW